MLKTLSAGWFVFLTITGVAFPAEPVKPIAESWDYAPTMTKVAARFKGKEGVVLHVGDSMTIADPYGQWARSGKGKTPEDEAILKWMHTGANDKTDGWWLCRTEVVDERSYTAVGGMQSTHLLSGGNRDNPPLAKMLQEHNPQMVILMVGIYDAAADRPLKEYRTNMAKAIDQILDHGSICLLSTIAPLHNRLELTRQYNQALRELAKERGLPLIDLEKEILQRRPDDWNGTLQRRNNIHLTAREANGDPVAAPTAENLSKSGYHLRGWLSVQKVAEVKLRVLDGKKAAPREDKESPPAKDLAAQLARLDPGVIVLGPVREPPLAGMLARDVRASLQTANQADRRAWEQLTTRADWQRFRDVRVQALRRSLGEFSPASREVKLRVTRSLEGDDDIRAVYVGGGLSGYQSVLQSPFCYLPHDAVIPGVLATGDLCDVAAALAPRPLRLKGLVDGLNRQVAADAFLKMYAPARDACRSADGDKRLVLESKPSSGGDVARWLQQHLEAK